MSLQPASQEGSAKKIALVDDDDLFRESLGLNLVEEGYEIVDFDNGDDALDYLLGRNGRSAGEADAVLLDWRMPVLDGLGVLRQLREADHNVPVIFLTVLSDEIYEEAALKFGAVDFIDKSRRLPIILQRLKLITNGPKATPQESSLGAVIQGHLELKHDIKRAFWRDVQVDLTLTEFSIVSFLAERPGEDVTYRQIYDLVRGKDFIAGYGADGFRANVRAFIKRIRKKFRDVDSGFDQIENYPGFGYRWRSAEEERAADASVDDDKDDD
ncbi:MAG: response regulator transcription factor [Rhodovibrionaceae bacterium]